MYEDADLIIIEKAAGVVTYPVAREPRGSAIQMVRRYWKANKKQNSFLYLIHRLDKGTSGLIVFAKTSLARFSLTEQFADHSVIRGYLAITSRIPAKRSGVIRAMLGRDARGRRSVVSSGKSAVTRYEVLKDSPATQRALISCRLETGRTHQIRIHLSHIGAPVLGDPVYGRDDGLRLALHAETLGFLHPRTRRPILLRSSLPTEMKRLLDIS